LSEPKSGKPYFGSLIKGIFVISSGINNCPVFKGIPYIYPGDPEFLLVFSFSKNNIEFFLAI